MVNSILITSSQRGTDDRKRRNYAQRTWQKQNSMPPIGLRYSEKRLLYCALYTTTERLLITHIQKKICCGDRLLPSPCLLYYFIVMFSEVGDLDICICIRTSHCLYLCTHRLRAAAALPWLAATQFSGCVDLFYLFATVWREVTWPLLCSNWGRDFSTLSSQTLLKKRSTVLWSWRDAELGVRSVCAVGDTTDEDRWVDLLCCSPHCDTAESCLTNNTLTTFSSSSDCYNDWRGSRHRPSADRPTTPAVRYVGVIYYAVVATCLLFSACC